MNRFSHKLGGIPGRSPFFKNQLSKLGFFSLLVFPISITTMHFVYGLVVFVLVVAGLFSQLASRADRYQATSEEKQFYFSMLIMLASAVFISLAAEVDYMALKKIGKFVLMLMAVPVYLYFRAYGVREKALWFGLVLGALASLLVGFFEVAFDIYKEGYPGRVKGATHPIIFGDLALMMGALGLVGLSWFRRHSFQFAAWPILGVISGVVASVLSLSRGGWVAIPFVVLVLLWVSRGKVSAKIQALGVLGLVVLMLTVYFVPQTGMKQKLNDTISNIQVYMDSDIDDSRRVSSIGIRFEMWQASWQIFKEYPAIGVGWGNYQEHAKRLSDQGFRNPVVAEWVHPHNQFLSAMVSGGVVGLIAVCAVFIIPAKIFVRRLNQSVGSGLEKRYALAGVMLLLVFAVFNLSESFLERTRTVAFFVFYLAVFMAGVTQSKNECQVVD